MLQSSFRKALIIACISLLAVTGCSQHKQRVEKIRNELKTEDLTSAKMDELAKILDGHVSVSNNYPVITMKITLKQYVPESVAKQNIEKVNAKASEGLCHSLDDFKTKYGADNSKALAEVLKEDNVRFDFLLEDQLGTKLMAVNQVLSQCQNFAQLGTP